MIITLNNITGSLCTQILDVQQTIASREDGQRAPTAQEVNLQCRLINCLIRLVKLAEKSADADNENRPDHTGNNQQAATPAQTAAPTPVQAAASEYAEPRFPRLVERQQPPFSFDDYQKHKHLLYNYDKPGQLTTFNGREVSKPWLEYNLLQYIFPGPGRRFVTDPAQYHNLVDHSLAKRQIAEQLRIIERDKKAA